LLVSNNILLSNGSIMPCFMTIVEYFVFLLSSVDSDLLDFVGNEGVDMVSPLMIPFILCTHIINLVFKGSEILYPPCLVFELSGL
jgi:hypothetical protein